jgi:hypothetical protein
MTNPYDSCSNLALSKQTHCPLTRQAFVYCQQLRNFEHLRKNATPSRHYFRCRTVYNLLAVDIDNYSNLRLGIPYYLCGLRALRLYDERIG